MTLSRSSHSRLQGWAIRAVAAFLVVYMIGTFGIPTLIPYVTALIAVLADGLRTWFSREKSEGRPSSEYFH
ncbi:MAG TPA: hypothetical protein VFA59_10440 [Vicinamibacterales bacterium]|nr:hypothetical protein [Vicinamibacterales bacterium]